MRRAGTLPQSDQAQRLADYLLTLGITTKVEPAGDEFALWVREEDRLTDARQAIEEFRAAPDHERYRTATTSARDIREETVRKAIQARRNHVEVRERWSGPGGMSAPRPLTFVLLVACIVVTAWTKFGDHRQPDVAARMRYFYIEPTVDRRPGEYRLEDLRAVRDGEVWRLLSPILPHLGLPHLIMNLMMWHALGGLIEVRRGTATLFALVVSTGVVSCLAQFLWEGPHFAGLSGVLYGLFGYAWMKSKFDPWAGIHLHPRGVMIMLVFLVVCMTGAIGPIANAAHTAGLVVGVAAGLIRVPHRGA